MYYDIQNMAKSNETGYYALGLGTKDRGPAYYGVDLRLDRVLVLRVPPCRDNHRTSDFLRAANVTDIGGVIRWRTRSYLWGSS